ncbi:MAG: hypothetical protein NC911_00830 [Candidatus Omnitrophica bacterium]|nr:hypothetical protein [Candidatus Omnitrophota bacterium]
METVDLPALAIGKVTAWLFDRLGRRIVIGSRMRLARNLPGLPFPHQATARQCRTLCQKIVQVFTDYPEDNLVVVDMMNLNEVEKAVLVEKHLVSLEFVQEDWPRVALIFPEQRISIMVNEEDHIRLQAFAPGLSLNSLWEKVDELDNYLDQQLTAAFHPFLGYLTACPTNLGTGFRVSALVHLPALMFTKKGRLIFSSLRDIGVIVRGWYGEGSPPAGDIFQISSGQSLGKTEREIIHEMQVVVKLIEKEERKMRQEMEANKRWRNQLRERLEGIQQASRLTTEEALSFISWLSLAAELNWLSLNGKNLGCLLTQILPGHLQLVQGRSLTPAQRDKLRAELLRKELKDLCLNVLPNG